ncbi:trypsin 5G1-like [Condylostylus longicornis]|uniref:trypsin 5G1-like n=1 Tax=Condylostylus longicornis TaxID=2530218 RepID=UPI00244DEFE6|nr:trypsin 5G1-like [Condylostylus longicornis]
MCKFKLFNIISITIIILNSSNGKPLHSISNNSNDGEEVCIENPRFGHTVTILYKDEIFTGVVHNAYNVLTVGHPFVDVNITELQVRIGSTYAHKGGQLISVKEIALHPKYYEDEFTFDLAFLRLSDKMDLIKYPVRNIIYYNQDITEPKVGESVFTTGWGQSHINGILKTANISIIDNKFCHKAYKYNGNTICAGYEPNKCATQVDSIGGPLVCELNSYIYLCGIKVHAKHSNKKKVFPGVYAKVNHPEILEWLRKGGLLDVEENYKYV